MTAAIPHEHRNDTPSASESPTAAELAPLLAPARPGAPTGDWLYYDRTYDLIREARREEDASLPRGIWKRELKRADWSEVVALCTAALSTRTKDLQIAAWLLEAWTKLYGYSGTLRGFQLIHGLCARYWADLHPRPDGDDFSARTLVIDWINENLVFTLQAIPLTRPEDADARVWNWAERVEALRLENQVLKGSASPPPPGADTLTSAKMFTSIISTPRAFFVRLHEDVSAGIEAARAVEQFFDTQFGSTAPSLTRVIEALKTIDQWVAGVLAQHVDKDAVSMPAPPETAANERTPEAMLMSDEFTDTPAQPASPAPMVDHARARADAYRKLAEAAHTLMRIEPHSPAPYLVFRAIAWGEMSLAELMRHFISSGYDLKSLYAMLGMEEQKPAKK